jgi:hypothetical protein
MSTIGWTKRQATYSCLVDAPNAESESKVHKEAQGLVVDEIHKVKQA